MDTCPTLIDVKALFNPEKSYKLCQIAGCYTKASFGKNNLKYWCALHRNPDDSKIVITGKVCKYEGCTRRPSYGFRYCLTDRCGQHKLPGQIDPFSRQCTFENCNKYASYSFSGECKTRCARHRLPGQITWRYNVLLKRSG